MAHWSWWHLEVVVVGVLITVVDMGGLEEDPTLVSEDSSLAM